MITLPTPNGINVMVPESHHEDPSEKFSVQEVSAAHAYYHKFGYVIFKNLIEQNVLKEIRYLWDREVKSSDKYIYRQATARCERHVVNERGWVMNPILNLQSLDPRHFGGIRKLATEGILCSARIRDCFTALLEESPKIVQSMYFEGNSATWEHQDTYYLDSEHPGSMAAAWVALENISAQAGRFFIFPRSHLIEMEAQKSRNNVADKHDVYISAVVERLATEALEARAPYLEAGDTLFWNSRTIHGSLLSHDRSSRSSITIHAIPASHRFTQLQSRTMSIQTESVNGCELWRPKDQGKIKNRLIMNVESHFPTLFYLVKKYAIKLLVR